MNPSRQLWFPIAAAMVAAVCYLSFPAGSLHAQTDAHLDPEIQHGLWGACDDVQSSEAQATDRLVLYFEEHVSPAEIDEFLRAQGATSQPELAKLHAARFEVSADQVHAAVAAFVNTPLIADVRADTRFCILSIPNDEFYSYQWGLTAINASAGWDWFTGTVTSTIAIVDTGVDLDHPDLAAKILPGYDFVNEDTLADDDHGHGTHVAGIAAALADNEIGVAGVNWQARILPLKVLDAGGSGWSSDVAGAIAYAADHGADVINMSLGGTVNDPLIAAAVNYAHERGVLVVAAAGNCGDPLTYRFNGCTILNQLSYPAGNAHVIAVAATDSSDNRASFSTANSSVDVAAPGAGILSTFVDGDYVYASGTSMATPFVSGLVALMRARYGDLTDAEVIELLEYAVQDLGAPGYDVNFGHGRIDLAMALPAGESVQLLGYAPGWSLFSTNVSPFDPQVESVFAPLGARLSQLFGDDRLYRPTLDSVYNTLHSLDNGQSYFVYLESPTPVQLAVSGTALETDSPIALEAGWNWIAYLPKQPLALSTALAGIDGLFQRVMSMTGVFDVSSPEFNTLTVMEPGQGYLIYMSEAAELIYPDTGGVSSADAPSVKENCGAAPTPSRTAVYGTVSVNGMPASSGTVIHAVDAVGDIAGCFVVQVPGRLGAMLVYGQEGPSESGMKPGEPITWHINGVPATPSKEIRWQNDWNLHSLQLSGHGQARVFLPMLMQ